MKKHRRAGRGLSRSLPSAFLCFFIFIGVSEASGLKFNKQSLDSTVLLGGRTNRPTLFGRLSIDSDAIFIDSSGTDMIFTDGTNTNVTLTTLAAAGAPSDAAYITQTANAALTAEQALSALAAGPLSNDAAGVLTTATIQVGRGGTGLTSGTSGGVPYFSAAQTIASSGAFTANAVVIGGGVGATPTTITADATSGHALFSTTTSPAFKQIVTPDVSGVWPDTAIDANAVTEAKLRSVDAPADEECLTYESTGGDFEWQACGGGGTPGGSDTQIQYNNAGAFGGTSGLSWDSANLRLQLGPGTGPVSLDAAGSFRTVPKQLTDAVTVNIDFSQSNFFYVTLAGNRTLANPTNTVKGQRVVLEVIQDATGGRKLTFGTAYKFGTDVVSYDASSTATSSDYLAMVTSTQNANSVDIVGISRGYR